MATSGVVDYTFTANQIILRAFSRAGLYTANELPTPAEVNDALDIMNLMILEWQNLDYGLWREREATVFLQKGQSKYSLGPTGDHATLSFDSTTLSSAASSGDSTIVVSDTTGFADTYNVGIRLDSGSLQWTTQSGAVSGSTVTLADTLDGDAASGQKVYVYQTKINRPLTIPEGYLRTNTNSDIPITFISKDQYNRFGNKTTQGNPIQGHYWPDLTNGSLYVFPAAGDVRHVIRIWGVFPIEVFTSTSEDAEFPQEWYSCLYLNLASRLADEFGSEDPNLERQAERAFLNAQIHDSAPGPIRFKMRPNYNKTYG